MRNDYGADGNGTLMVFALSSTFVTGSGQFMVCNLWLAGVPAASIVASVAAISSRFALYIGGGAAAPNLVPSELVEFLTEPVCFFWYHGQTLL